MRPTPNQLSTYWRIGMLMLVGVVFAAAVGYGLYRLAIAPILTTPATDATPIAETASSSGDMLNDDDSEVEMNQGDKLQLLAELRKSTTTVNEDGSVNTVPSPRTPAEAAATVPSAEEEAEKEAIFSELRSASSAPTEVEAVAETTVGSEDTATLELLSELRNQ